MQCSYNIHPRNENERSFKKCPKNIYIYRSATFIQEKDSNFGTLVTCEAEMISARKKRSKSKDVLNDTQNSN